jgi:GIY-YIG catalytic domain
MSILSYTPDIQLAESLIATYFVYVLKDPTDNNEVFYVGKTVKDLKTRLSGHLSDSGDGSEKGSRIQEIINKGDKPIIEAIETIYGTCYIDKIKNLSREYYWIRHFLKTGSPLTNIVGKDGEGKNIEYESYLNNVKNKSLQWHYYYCGRTKYGIKVYDEERMNEDGFKFPASNNYQMEPSYDEVISESITETKYDPVYDDESPDYIKGSIEEM